MDTIQFKDMEAQLKSVEWRWFLASPSSDKNHRRQAKCKQCDKVLTGRLETMRNHLLHDCKKLSATDKAKYVGETQSPSQGRKSGQVSSGSQASSESSVVPQKRPASAISQYFPTTVSGGRKKALDEKLLEALIVGNVPFNFVECPQFREYAAMLGHKLPSRSVISGHHLQDMFTRHFNNMLTQLSTVNELTVLLDGWTDVSGNSIYAYIGQTREDVFVLDICHLKQRPSADNIRSQMFDVLTGLHISTKQILALTTDTPNVMEKLRRDVSNEHPNILSIKCGLHALNLAIQGALKHKSLLEIFKENQTIANFFKSSHYWLDRLREWMRENGVTKGLQTYTATRWYSAVQVALSVAGVEEGLMVCLGESFVTQNPLPQKVSRALQNPGHFSKTRALVKLLKPLTDAIARLERLSASLDQIFISIITSYRQVQEAELEIGLGVQSWKVAVLSAISSASKRFNHPVYFVALFLNPEWQAMAISRKYNVESITREVLILAKNFGFSKNQCIQLKSDIIDYIALVQVSGQWNDIDPWSWWNQQSKCQQLRLLALKVLSVRPHTAAVERLFSSLGLAKTKSRNRLNVEKMKMIAIIRTRIRVQEERKRSARSFPSNQRATNLLEEEEESQTIDEEMDIEVEPIEVEVESGSDGQDITFSEEDKTLVNELFDISTYCLAQPRNPRQEEEEGDESDFSINDIL
jgi:Protein of unknown function (DUF 659)/hAT family C-terminal dimerisation region